MDLNALMLASPYHRWLGLQLVRAEGGEVEIRLPYRAEFASDDEGTNIHGGIIATLADIAGCLAVINATGRDAPTLNIRMDYLRMARGGESLVAAARVIKTGRTVGIADIEVRAGEERLVAVGRGTFATNAPSRETLTGRS